ncbi:hypothetical protein EDEG_02073 [Edhazardia aedis USNM 41457]|uniref:Uncharacterized protein n=1 Tax=Edhazardia aedis (strain USNM 41457) TaxID=1003232 RepID=J9DLZ2_EDHAE|nr:hypothetical protein EDEG_02073 [Edhazardia aedis USNM 41457]|eukprot:EJW03605.1 hypothetical protein EDEG_02073 [Edhazardia aedis USNM 41457]
MFFKKPTEYYHRALKKRIILRIEHIRLRLKYIKEVISKESAREIVRLYREILALKILFNMNWNEVLSNADQFDRIFYNNFEFKEIKNFSKKISSEEKSRFYCDNIGKYLNVISNDLVEKVFQELYNESYNSNNSDNNTNASNYNDKNNNNESDLNDLNNRLSKL